MDPVNLALGAAGVTLALSGARTIADDMSRRMLFVDTYHGAWPKASIDDWRAVGTTANLYGAIIKASNGTADPGAGWFPRNWKMSLEAMRERYGGGTWFRGAYHFLRPDDGAAQADKYLSQIEAGGGWGPSDMVPIVDVERGSNKNSAQWRASAQQWIDTCSAFAERVVLGTGQGVMLYGRGLMRDLGITHKMGCDRVWNPAWTAKMERHGLEAWTLDNIVMWQYSGDGVSKLVGYPNGVNVFGTKSDMSVYIDGARPPTMASFRARVIRRE